MFKRYLTIIFIFFFYSSSAYSADNPSSEDAVWKKGTDDISYLKGKNSNFKKGKDALKQAMRYEKKKKFDKAQKRFNDTIKFFTLANKENSNEPEILYYLGYSFFKVNDFAMAEIYFEQGLLINSEHIGINQYLGRLYVETKRIHKAKERLIALEKCKCEEFQQLNALVLKN